MDTELVGVGLYTPAEAARLLAIPAGKIRRWLSGHTVRGLHYERLWKPQVELDDNKLYLGFKDLMELRAASRFIAHGVSPQQVRRAIEIAAREFAFDHPMSTMKFRTDGRTIFLQIDEVTGSDPKLVDIFNKQYAFQRILEPSLKDIDFDDDGRPGRWWPASKEKGIVVDPERCFGQPIDDETGVPTCVLAAAAHAERSVASAAAAWRVPARAVRRALQFEASGQKLAA